MIDLIAELAGLWGPPGHEGQVAAALQGMLTEHVGEVRRDALGNLIATRQGGGLSLMLIAHMDAPGGIVTHVEESGLIRIAGAGAFSPALAYGQRVRLAGGLSGSIASEGEPKEATNLWLDCGFSRGEEARQHVQIGDAWTYDAPITTQGQRIIAPGLDGRAACAVLVEVARHLHLARPEYTIHLVFTVQELHGPRGGGPAAFGLQPDAAVVVDASPAGDVPGAPRSAGRLGGGCMLRAKEGRFISHVGLLGHLRNLAEAHAVPYAVEVLAEGSGEAALVEAAGAGVPTAVIGLPLRAAGTPGEVADVRDARAAADLLLQLLSTEFDLA